MPRAVIYFDPSTPGAHPELTADQRDSNDIADDLRRLSRILVTQREKILPVRIEDADAFVGTDPDVLFLILEKGIHLVGVLQRQAVTGIAKDVFEPVLRI